ncbi:hypothetical protein [Bradyrhizobium canariense]|uniref:hypothetical protein n=1 Tax=Bradyrhizobium canariense TaxID=255045 RepID=UPI0013024F89|nr:hypothetical protein [Bradyrhizobium canariense]
MRRMTVWVKDRTQGGLVSVGWLKMLPDVHSRRARDARTMDKMEGAALVECEFSAVIE